MVDKIVEGRMNKYYEEVCLYEQPFIKENTTSIQRCDQGEDRQARREHHRVALVRFKVGDAVSADTSGSETPAAE